MGDPHPFRRPAPRSAAHREHGTRTAAAARRADASSWRDAARGLGPVLLAAPLAVFSAILLADGMPELRASPQITQAHSPAVLVEERFGPCLGGVRYTCVVDGDTIWLRGDKIRIADIDAPEISRPACEAERAVGLRTTTRLTAWLNEAPFEVHPNPDGRDEDRFGRKLRVLSRNGSSALEPLVAAGLATRWGEARRRWC